MENMQSAVDNLVHSSNTLFILLGAVMVLAMHAGFAFLEVGTVRQKNQVNALSKILSDFAVSTLAYFFVGYWISYGVTFLQPAAALNVDHGYSLVKFFFLLTFAAAIPAIISGGIAERARFSLQLCATVLIVAFVYPFFEGVVWNGNFGLQAWLQARFGAGFHDFAGSVVVHAMGGWLALAAVLLLGPRNGRYRDGRLVAFAPSSIPFLALGSWILIVGWFGFNVMSAQTLPAVSGLVAINSLMAMVGGTVAALVVGRNDPGFLHNGPLAGLVAICAGSDLMHPIGALVTGAIAGALFVWCFTAAQGKWKIDDVLGVWPLHGLCGVWGGIACGIFGQSALGGLGGVSLISQLIGTTLGIVVALCGGFAVYGAIKVVLGLRLTQEQEYYGADLSIHKIGAVSQD
ncbi:ammonium transporter [Pseudomonas hefeiensis]|uniref:Ammonium transporter n=1 Tax=Pseudomonas hefeiensis TaxID=2738125 RepID=A0ABY9G6G2_9PSED|nr:MULTISPECIES: ammonium transporter [unclassified Pseudomonas]WLH11140.1 ammonium transporter [Pseudomonas sp. FP205]WLH94213.1 ammonium transporter [Pseudomonas sp. FP53]WLI38488.1 ammonium transporter [Pseudomonas sp. FP821]